MATDVQVAAAEAPWLQRGAHMWHTAKAQAQLPRRPTLKAMPVGEVGAASLMSNPAA
jgi:hypothetical protein